MEANAREPSSNIFNLSTVTMPASNGKLNGAVAPHIPSADDPSQTNKKTKEATHPAKAFQDQMRDWAQKGMFEQILETMQETEPGLFDLRAVRQHLLAALNCACREGPEVFGERVLQKIIVFCAFVGLRLQASQSRYLEAHGDRLLEPQRNAELTDNILKPVDLSASTSDRGRGQATHHTATRPGDRSVKCRTWLGRSNRGTIRLASLCTSESVRSLTSNVSNDRQSGESASARTSPSSYLSAARSFLRAGNASERW